MNTQQNRRNKASALAFWQAVDNAQPRDVARICRDRLAPEFVWRGPAPFTALVGADAFAGGYLEPLRYAVSGLCRETHLFLGGASQGKVDGSPDGRMWVGGSGYLVGESVAAFARVPAAGREVRIRWGEFLRFEGDAIVEIQTLLDVVDWLEQLGHRILPPSKGAPFVYPAPTAYHGVLAGDYPAEEGARTLALGRRLVFGALNSYDQSDLGSMGMASYFHKHVKWYGPGGIGACLSLKEFEDLHQKPWLIAFPDRRVQNLDSLFAEDRLVASSGWAGVKATHAGPYLGTPASGNRVAVNGIDFWLRTGGQFTENWVFVDMPHLFAQFGVDLFDILPNDGSGLV
jgi:predicted ester cyclase